jgi:hypothetical protein
MRFGWLISSCNHMVARLARDLYYMAGMSDKSHTDAATINRLSTAAKRILTDWCWHQDKGLKEYHGAAGCELAVYELRDAGCGTTYEAANRSPRITLGPKGRRIARRIAQNMTR